MKTVIGVKSHFRNGVHVKGHFKTVKVKAESLSQAQRLAGEDAVLTGFESHPEKKKGRYVYTFED